MLQHDQPDTYIIGTGEVRTVRQLCETAFKSVDLDWQKHIVVDPRFIRLTKTGTIVADATKARAELGWSPRTSFTYLVKMMVDHQIRRLKNHSN
jgi:GDPmannose 4,6-dehydratase